MWSFKTHSSSRAGSKPRAAQLRLLTVPRPALLPGELPVEPTQLRQVPPQRLLRRVGARAGTIVDNGGGL
jgi:hypothetical protein